jgi:hypothetical protein
MSSLAALMIVNCETITLTGNYFDGIRKKSSESSTARGAGMPVLIFSSKAFALNARFNLFNNNYGGLMVASAINNDNTDFDPDTRSFVIPTGVIEFNQFIHPSSNHKFDLALADITASDGGPNAANSANFNSMSLSGTIDANRNYFTHKLSSTAMSLSTTVYTVLGTASGQFNCYQPTSVLTGTNTCGDESTDCGNGKFGDLKYQTCVSASN